MAPGNAFRDRWTDAVYASKLTLAQRDTLHAYARFMDRRGVIQVQRKRIADMTRRPTSHIDEHIAVAIAVGLLELVDRHGRGRPATYRAMVPGWPDYPTATVV